MTAAEAAGEAVAGAMGRGGARNRSGPPADPGSGRSEARGYKLTALPSEGYAGEPPEFPLPDPSIREIDVWVDAWRTPQACAWSLPSEQWRIPTIALWVRVKVRCESAEAPATLFGQLHRLADQIGMTPAGLAQMGWKVAVDELGERAAGRASSSSPSIGSTEEKTEDASRPARRPRRLRAVGDQ